MMNKKNNGCLLIFVIVLLFGFYSSLFKKEAKDSEIPAISTNIQNTINPSNALGNSNIKNENKKYSSTNDASKSTKNSNKQNKNLKRKKNYSSENKSYKSYSSPKVNSRQCIGLTKKGSRCRNITKSSNGLCWRHGG